MSPKRQRVLLLCFFFLDFVLAPLLTLRVTESDAQISRILGLGLVHLGATAWFRLIDPTRSPRLDTRLVAQFLAAFGAAALTKLIAPDGPTSAVAWGFGLFAVATLGRLLCGIVGYGARQRLDILGQGPRSRYLRLALARNPWRSLVVDAGRGEGAPRVDTRSQQRCVAAEADYVLPLNFGLEDELAQIGPWLLRPAEGPGWGVSDRLKRSLDLVIILLLLPLIGPLVLILLATLRLFCGPRPLYTQTRVTQGARVFRIYKLRTMLLDAEPGGRPTWPGANDRRITAVGSILRRFWLDELPQAWNVIKGDLSLVGPRPERPEFVQVFTESLSKYPLRHRARAGITGLAQARGFVGNTSLRKRLHSDLAYINTWSLWRDVMVLLRTLCQIFVRTKRERFDFEPGDGGRLP